MFEKIDIFSDIFAHKENILTGIEARIKIVFVILALIINLISPTIYAPLSIAFVCLIALFAIGTPSRLLALRLTMPLIMAAVVLITQIYFFGHTVLFSIQTCCINLIGYKEGLAHGVLIMCRVIGGVSLILFLSISTPAYKLLLAATWFRVPKVVIELSLLIYRYIFVLLEEVLNIRDAQRIRLGYHNWRQSMRSLILLGASLIFRAYDRAERIFQAMSARGYTGSIVLDYSDRFGKKEVVTSVCLSVILLSFYFMGRLSTC
jgi:cobalt/nickel transport system permease protein